SPDRIATSLMNWAHWSRALSCGHMLARSTRLLTLVSPMPCWKPQITASEAKSRSQSCHRLTPSQHRIHEEIAMTTFRSNTAPIIAAALLLAGVGNVAAAEPSSAASGSYVTTSDGVQLYYKDWGPKDGQVVTFSHGWP